MASTRPSSLSPNEPCIRSAADVTSTQQRIYLDNAATSWPKPEAVYDAVNQYQRNIGAPAGRSTYREASEAARLVHDARRQLAELIGIDDPQRIVFTLNGTDALNLAILGLLKTGEHLVTTVVEHNSVLRPVRYLEQTRGIEATRVSCSSDGIVDPDDIRRAIRSNTRLIALNHVSNVTGAVQPAREVGRLAKEHGVIFLLDAAQSMGHLPVNAADLGVDLLAAPGHKGLLGPLGTGFLYVAPGLERALEPLRQGGTGTQSEIDLQPDTLPERYEPGNHNLPGLAGLNAALASLRERGIARLREHESMLTQRLVEAFREVPGVLVHGPTDPALRSGVVSISVEGYDPQEVALLLDSSYSVQVRSGLHCAPRMHDALQTTGRGGTVRFSVGPFNTLDEMEVTTGAVAEIASSVIT